MANRVLVMEITPLKEGENYHLLAFYDINPLIAVGGVVVVPTPADQLPEICDEYNLVPQAYKNKLNAGDSMFEIHVVKRREGQTEQQLLALVESKYPARAARVVANWRRRFERTGAWVVDI